MTRAASGDQVSFAEIVRGTNRFVHGIVYRYLGDSRESEDLAQEVYLRAWKARKSYEPTAPFTSWLGTITARLCLSERHRRTNKRTVELNPDAIIESDVDREPQAVRRAVLSLPDTQRMAIVLRYYGGLSYQQVAEGLGVSMSAAQGILLRARRKLIDLLPADIKPEKKG